MIRVGRIESGYSCSSCGERPSVMVEINGKGQRVALCTHCTKTLQNELSGVLFRIRKNKVVQPRWVGEESPQCICGENSVVRGKGYCDSCASKSGIIRQWVRRGVPKIDEELHRKNRRYYAITVMMGKKDDPSFLTPKERHYFKDMNLDQLREKLRELKNHSRTLLVAKKMKKEGLSTREAMNIYWFGRWDNILKEDV